MECILCRETGFYGERFCPMCDGWGSVAAMLENPPKFNTSANVIRRMIKEGYILAVLIMDDRTFRIYHSVRSPKDPEREHFAVGLVLDKTDNEIQYSAGYLLSGGGVQSFHEDGTPHK